MKYLVCKVLSENDEDPDLGLPIEPVYIDGCFSISSIESFFDYYNENDEKEGTVLTFFNGSNSITNMPFTEVLNYVKQYEKESLFQFTN